VAVTTAPWPRLELRLFSEWENGICVHLMHWQNLSRGLLAETQLIAARSPFELGQLRYIIRMSLVPQSETPASWLA